METPHQALPHLVSLMTKSPEATMPPSVYGIDLAKHRFSIHGEDHQGKLLIHRTISRSKALSTFANITPAIDGMEACCASHYWARELAKLGHTLKIICMALQHQYQCKPKMPRVLYHS
ncbi:hypothetical protein KDD30_20465 (plasmid) [Photobacterium sp. GJ3]|uniref:hypothetical protein n=1 Tax=Photobacterium sp. GJ3 TaxID=2829502 RepID=UPI001B8BA02D|nr:hypothetical protein [Photobacterium sp. GJ3]QUJ70469.1 hypothetical protein KDD30_20465 [Photobacterium sp. GJ3]